MNIFEFIDGMSSIRRWSHAFCHKPESVLEHTAVVCFIALEIGIKHDVDMAKLLKRALVHDMEEVITGDIPTPTKYYNDTIASELKDFEEVAAMDIANKVFTENEFRNWLSAKDYTKEGQIIQIADAAAVVYKIKQEVELGNRKFLDFHSNIWNALTTIKIDCYRELIPEVDKFIDILKEIK